MHNHLRKLRWLLLIVWGATTAGCNDSSPSGPSVRRSGPPAYLQAILDDKSIELPDELLNKIPKDTNFNKKFYKRLTEIRTGERTVNELLGILTVLHRSILLAYQYHGKYRETSLRLLKRLLNRGAHINELDQNGRTPIYRAVKLGVVDAVKILVAGKPDLSIVGDAPAYYTPLQEAASNAALGSKEDDSYKKNFEIMNILLDAGADPTQKGGQGNTPIEAVNGIINCGSNKHKVIARLEEAVKEWEEKHR